MMTMRTTNIARDLLSTFPELGDVEPLAHLGGGFRSIVVKTAGDEVFKIARNWEGGAGYAKELRLLPLIRNRLPLPVPYPVWHAGPSKQFPFGVIGYPMLAGTPMSGSDARNHLATLLGRFLKELHAIPITDEIAESVPQPRAYWDEAERLRNTLVSPLREALDASEYRIVHRWWRSFLDDQQMHRFKPVLHHGDFWFGNILFDGGTLTVTGIVDWENAALGDPAQDIATLLHLGRVFTLQCLNEYVAAGGILDQGLLYRAQRLWELREFVGIGFAIKTTNQDEYEDAIRKLRKGPLLNATARKETALWPPPQG